jgi:hypothetical protein
MASQLRPCCLRSEKQNEKCVPLIFFLFRKACCNCGWFYNPSYIIGEKSGMSHQLAGLGVIT